MKKFNPNRRRRKSLRLKGYDYSQKGLYFVTICVQNRACLFGDIQNGVMHLNDAGTMIEKWYYELENKFPDIQCGTHVVMPDHFHCIIHNVGANLGVGTDVLGSTSSIDSNFVGISSEHVGSPLYRVIQWFKTMTTNEYIRKVKTDNWPRFDRKLWQRNYWEHIIRNERAHQNISKYILNNPLKWKGDTLNRK